MRFAKASVEMMGEVDDHAVWTGLMEAVGEPGSEMIEPNDGAIIRIFAWAENGERFEARAREAARHYKMRVLGFEDIEAVGPGKTYGETRERADELIARTAGTKGVILGTFYAYPLDQA